MWWNIATPDKKANAQKLIKNGQLEIVTGGWVMNDEANTHYFEMIDQMIEGKCSWFFLSWSLDSVQHSDYCSISFRPFKFSLKLLKALQIEVNAGHISFNLPETWG